MNIGLDGILLRRKNAGSLRYFQQLILALMDDSLPKDSHLASDVDPEDTSKQEAPGENELRTNTTSLSVQKLHTATKIDHLRIFADQRVLEDLLEVPYYQSQIAPNKNLETNTTTLRKDNIHIQLVKSWEHVPAALQQQSYRSWDDPVRLDLLHSPVFIPPLTYPGKTIMTIQDLTFLLYPETQKWTGRFWWRMLVKPGLKKADCIIAISESTRTDLMKYFQVPNNKVRLVHHYPLPHFRPVKNARQVASHYGLPDEYILFVGTIEPRKNLPFLINAYHQAVVLGNFQHSLVIVGKRGWKVDDVFNTVERLNLNKQVIFLDYLPDKDLPAIYTAAKLFVFLSKYEGFGIPPLEAMACGTPVIASNTSSIPEVVGQAGILVSPSEIDQTVQEMQRILQDKNLQKHLSEIGMQRASLFTKARFKSETLAAYQTIVSQNNNDNLLS